MRPAVAVRRDQQKLEAIDWCGGVYSSEWGFSKLLHWLRHNPDKRDQFVTAFEQYAPWYDLLYEDKDYAAETSFVEHQLRRHGAASGSLLDLGCGTGVHAVQFAQNGWYVTGIDLVVDGGMKVW